MLQRGYRSKSRPTEVPEQPGGNRALTRSPRRRNERRVFVMRDDGVLFGEAIDPKVKSLADLGIGLRADGQTSPIACCGIPRA